MSHLRSTRPKFVSLLATRCHYWGYVWTQSNGPKWVPLLVIRCHYWVVHLSSGQPHPTEYQSWPPVASTGRYIWPQVSLTQRLTKCQADLKEDHSRPLDTSTRGYVSSQVNQTQLFTTHGHQMPLLGVCLSSGQSHPTEYQSWLLDAFTGRYIWPQVSLIQWLTKCQAELKEYYLRPLDTSTREYV